MRDAETTTSSRLGLAGMIAGVSGVVLLVSLIKLPWFEATVNGEARDGGATNGLESFAVIDLALLATAILAVGVVVLGLAGARPSIRLDASRLVAGLGVVAIVLIGYRIAEVPIPGDVSAAAEVDVTRKAGLVVALLAAAGIAISDVFGPRARPPGAGSRPDPVALALPSSPASAATIVPPPPDSAALAAPAAPAAPAPAPVASTASPTPPATPAAAVEPAPADALEPRSAAAIDPEPTVDPEPEPEPEPAPERAPGNGPLSLASADFEDLRGIGLSVTQAKRVLRHRDELGAVHTVPDLDQVPGLPRTLLADLQTRLVD